MQLTGFRHKGLKQIHAGVTAKGVPAALTDKLRKLLFALETADGLEQVSRFPGWKLHPLKGALRGFWSSTVTGNWPVSLSLPRRGKYRQRYRLD